MKALARVKNDSIQSELSALNKTAGTIGLVQIKFSLVVITTFGVNPDQPQGVGATLVTHAVTHGQDYPVSSSDGTEAPQYLQCFLNDLLDIITYWLVLRARLDEYHSIGARFAKWRAVITIGTIPASWLKEA